MKVQVWSTDNNNCSYVLPIKPCLPNGKETLIAKYLELYGFPHSTAAFHVLNNIRDYNKKGQLKKELSSLYLQKYAINEFCSRHSQAIMALMSLKGHRLTEDRILELNNFLENNGYNTDVKSNI
jgi:hypothetical protein